MAELNIRQKKLEKIKQNIRFPDGCDSSRLLYLQKEVTRCTTVIDSDAREFEIEKSVNEDLKKAQQINWCRTIHTLQAVKVPEGNRFLFVVSFALWGFPDAGSLLRRLLYVFVSDFAKDRLFDLWVRSKDYRHTTVELDFKQIIEMTRCESEGIEAAVAKTSEEFPRPLHIFAIANILRRPIIIVGHENDPQTGLYLPVMWKADDCVKYPLIFAFHAGAYFPLLNQELQNNQKKIAEYAVPLVTSDLNPLKLQFLFETEKDAYTMLQNYLTTTEINLTRSNDICLILSAKLHLIPFEVDDMLSPSNPNVVEGFRFTEALQSGQNVPANVIPTAPSASIITLNNLGETPVEPREMSMLQETCRFPGCLLFTSRYTEPYCHEHVNNHGTGAVLQRPPQDQQPPEQHVEFSLVNERCREARCSNFASRFIYPYCYQHIDRKAVEFEIRRRPTQNQPLPESSVVMERCIHGNCQNYASQYIYPFCYEHIDDHEINTGALLNLPGNEPTSQGFEISVMAEKCAHPNCHNHASKYTFPVCYEHLDSPHAIRRAATATRIVQLPHQVLQRQERISNGVQQMPKRTPEVQEIDKKFEASMKELETRTRNGAPLCPSAGCSNFGNSKCRGYCHSCYSLLRAN